MPIITLTTDFGTKDHFVATVKGAIYTELPTAKIVDISHNITPFSITETAYIVKNSYKSFPEKTIHIIGVDAEFSEENKHIAIELDNHYFICPDNGVISMITSEIKPSKIVEINIHKYTETTFPLLDIFVKIATHIARGGSLSVIGKDFNNIKKLVEIQPKIEEDENKTIIKGEVIYIDNYGNAVTNITKKLFNKTIKGRNYTVNVRHLKFEKINNKYNDIVDFSSPENIGNYDGKEMVLFNSGGFLEIAMYRSNKITVGGASTLIGLRYRDNISIEFKN